MGLRGPKPRRKEIVWSTDFAYAVGLLASDGCLSPDGRHLVFVSKDLEQIQNLKKCLGITANASHKPYGNEPGSPCYYRLQWGDVTLYNFLLDVGLTANKSLTLGPLLIPDIYFLDFLRGSFDGDGSFYSYFDPRWKNSFMFYMTFTSASRSHIDWLRVTLKRLLYIHGHVTNGKKGNGIYNLKYAKQESMTLLEELYAQEQSPHLLRKRLKIEAALRIVGKSLRQA